MYSSTSPIAEVFHQEPPFGVFLTYAAAGSGDGLGAQAQRLMGIYSAANELGLGYMHTPIRSIEVNPGDPHVSPRERFNYLQRVNELFSLPSDTGQQPSSVMRLKSLSTTTTRSLQLLNKATRLIRKSIVVELPSSLPWSDQHPDSYRWASEIVRRRMPESVPSAVCRIDVHIRRAVAPPLGRDGKPYDRFVPTEWYVEALDAIVRLLHSIGVSHQIRIHTDLPKSRWKVPGDLTPGTLAMWKHHNLVDDQGFLRNSAEDLADEFSGFSSVEIARGWDPIDALVSMVDSDVFIMCASSLSYVAGLMRTGKPTVSPQFFHQPQTSWLVGSNRWTPSQIDYLLSRIRMLYA